MRIEIDVPDEDIEDILDGKWDWVEESMGSQVRDAVKASAPYKPKIDGLIQTSNTYYNNGWQPHNHNCSVKLQVVSTADARFVTCSSIEDGRVVYYSYSYEDHDFRKDQR